jgi:hypothetical protein
MRVSLVEIDIRVQGLFTDVNSPFCCFGKKIAENAKFLLKFYGGCVTIRERNSRPNLNKGWIENEHKNSSPASSATTKTARCSAKQPLPQAQYVLSDESDGACAHGDGRVACDQLDSVGCCSLLGFGG